MDFTWLVQPPKVITHDGSPQKLIRMPLVSFTPLLVLPKINLKFRLIEYIDVALIAVRWSVLLDLIIQFDLELLRSLIRFILLLLLFTRSSWSWFIDYSIPLTRHSIWILLKTAAIYPLTFYGWLGRFRHKDLDPGDFPLLPCHDQYLLRRSRHALKLARLLIHLTQKIWLHLTSLWLARFD